MPKRIVFKIDNEDLATPVNRVLCDLELPNGMLPQSKLTLKNVVAKLNWTDVGYEYINVYISGVIGKNYVIDSDKGFNFLQVTLSEDRVYTQYEPGPPAVQAYMTNVRYTNRDTNESFTMGSQLQNQVEFAVFDKFHNPINPNDIYVIMLVFEYEDPLTERPSLVFNNGVQSFSNSGQVNRNAIF